MPKVNVIKVTALDKKTPNGDPFVAIELEDGRKGTAYTVEALEWKGEMELEVKEGKKIGEIQYYNIFAPKTKPKGSFPTKDYAFEKRNASLQRAIESAMIFKETIKTSDQIITLARKYYEYLNEK